jgi:hypothetical protein
MAHDDHLSRLVGVEAVRLGLLIEVFGREFQVVTGTSDVTVEFHIPGCVVPRLHRPCEKLAYIQHGLGAIWFLVHQQLSPVVGQHLRIDLTTWVGTSSGDDK